MKHIDKSGNGWNREGTVDLSVSVEKRRDVMCNKWPPPPPNTIIVGMAKKPIRVREWQQWRHQRDLQGYSGNRYFMLRWEWQQLWRGRNVPHALHCCLGSWNSYYCNWESVGYIRWIRDNGWLWVLVMRVGICFGMWVTSKYLKSFITMAERFHKCG